MKNLNLIFNLLLFPFLILIRFYSSQNSSMHSRSRELAREKYLIFSNNRAQRKNPFIFLSLLVLSTLLPLQLTAAVDVCPGDTLNNLNNTSSDATQTVNTSLPAYTTYYYTFTPAVAGKIQVNSSANRSYNSLFIKDGCGANLWSDTGNSDDKSSPQIDVAANQQIVIAFERRWDTPIDVELDFTFTVVDPKEICPGVVIPNLDGTTVSATDSFSNETIDNNKDYYYYFTPDVNGRFEVYTRSNRSGYNLRVQDGCGSDLGSDTTSNDNKYVGWIPVNASQQIVVRVDRNYDTLMTYDIDFNFVVSTPPVMGDIPDQSVTWGSTYSLNIANYATEADGDTITYALTGPLPTGLSFDTSTGILSGVPITSGTFSLSATATDRDGTSNADSFTLTVSPPPPADAVDDSFSTNINTTIIGNVLTNDLGEGLTVTSHIAPSNGSFSISSDGVFNYTPNTDYVGTDTFSYTIIDNSANTDSATVTVTVTEETDFQDGYQDFVKINPPSTYNIPGDFVLAGNTVMCLTGEDSDFGGTCTNSGNNNADMGRYIDIDGTSGIGTKTFNSSSSNIILPPQARKVLWAGLFWQGNINGEDWENQRLGVQSGNSWYYQYNDEAGGTSPYINLDYETNGASEVLVKVGNDSDYSAVSANTLYNVQNPSYGSNNAGEYAAFSDVTSLFSNYTNLSSESDTSITVTVANISTNEGRTSTDGDFGGWSLAVIYEGDVNHEDTLSKNISIYNGYGRLKTSTGETSITATVSGFRLPSGTDPVNAQFGVFAGEGEVVYSPDSLYINHGTGNQKVASSNNVFDSAVSGIVRDATHSDNVMTNLDSLDIDLYDVSDIMTSADRSISELDLELTTGQDTIFPSMFAFSVELYVPNLCYDYTLDIYGYVVDSINNQIKTPFGGFGAPLTTHLYIRSEEGDLDLANVNISYSIGDTSQLEYITDSTEISETGRFSYVDADPWTVNETISGFDMYIGTGATGSSGGIISPNEDRYIKLDSKFKSSIVSTYFNFSINYKIDFGSGGVEHVQHFSADDLCPAGLGGFLPELGRFNIVDGGASHDQYNLYTQVANRPFDLTIYAHDVNTPTDLIDTDLNLSIEVEMIRADNFSRDSDVSCNDEHSMLPDVPAKFTHFDIAKSADISYEADDLSLAYRSAAMRVWYLTDPSENGTLVNNHDCTRENQSNCIDLYSREYASIDTQCVTECTTGSECYDCLRTYYGRMVCSRDNFAIRPESFITELLDSNESNDITKTSNHIANSVTDPGFFSVIAGYNYRFDINATNHQNNAATPRYIQHFEPGSPTHGIKMRWYPNGHTVTDCNDVVDKNISINIFNGSDVNHYAGTSYIDKVDQIGKYRFEIFDSNWTSVDWNSAEMEHHYGSYSSYFITGPDCASGSDVLVSATTVGCEINSVHTNNNTGQTYDYLYAQYYPYAFDVTGLTFGARPSNDGGNDTFVYINTPDLTLYPDGIDENMSYNVQGSFAAVGRTGDRVSNFVENCYADSVDMSLYQNYNHAEPATEPYLSYDLIDFNTTDTSHIIRARENGIFSHSNIDSTDPLVPLVIPQAAEYFEKDMNGSLTMDLGYNFARQMNIALNPRYVNMKDFNLTYTAPPPGIHVDLETDHKIFGNINIDQNVTFLYGRAKPAQTYYETIENNIDTPVSTVVYCDLGYTVCQNRNILALVAQTNEANWWKSWDHNNNPTIGGMDGTIELVSAPISALNSTSVTIISEGEDPTVNVNNGGVAPLLVPVNLVVNDPASPPAPANYTDRWLIYNEYSATAPPIPFYRVKFLGASGWVGKGDTGHVVGDDVNTKNNRRLEW